MLTSCEKRFEICTFGILSNKTSRNLSRRTWYKSIEVCNMVSGEGVVRFPMGQIISTFVFNYILLRRVICIMVLLFTIQYSTADPPTWVIGVCVGWMSQKATLNAFYCQPPYTIQAPFFCPLFGFPRMIESIQKFNSLTIFRCFLAFNFVFWLFFKT